MLCGGRGIRTLEKLSPLTVFKTAAFNHSAIPPNYLIVTQAVVGGLPSWVASLNMACDLDSKTSEK